MFNNVKLAITQNHINSRKFQLDFKVAIAQCIAKARNHYQRSRDIPYNLRLLLDEVEEQLNGHPNSTHLWEFLQQKVASYSFIRFYIGELSFILNAFKKLLERVSYASLADSSHLELNEMIEYKEQEKEILIKENKQLCADYLEQEEIKIQHIKENLDLHREKEELEKILSRSANPHLAQAYQALDHELQKIQQENEQLKAQQDYPRAFNAIMVRALSEINQLLQSEHCQSQSKSSFQYFSFKSRIVAREFVENLLRIGLGDPYIPEQYKKVELVPSQTNNNNNAEDFYVVKLTMAEWDDLQEKIDFLQHSSENASMSYQHLKEKLTAIQKEKQRLQDKVEQAENPQLIEDFMLVQQENQVMKDEIAKLQESIHSLRTENTKLKSENHRLMMKLNKLMCTTHELMQQNKEQAAQFEKEKTKLQEKCAELTVDFSDNKQVTEKLVESVQTLLNKQAEYESQQRRQQHVIANMQRSLQTNNNNRQTRTPSAYPGQASYGFFASNRTRDRQPSTPSANRFVP